MHRLVDGPSPRYRAGNGLADREPSRTGWKTQAKINFSHVLVAAQTKSVSPWRVGGMPEVDAPDEGVSQAMIHNTD